MCKVGIRIKQFREEKRIQQKELALVVGISQSLLSKIEANSIIPNAELLKKISQYLHVSVDEFYGSDNKKSSAGISSSHQRTDTKHGKYSLKNQIEKLEKVIEYHQNTIDEYKIFITQLNDKIERRDKKIEALKKQFGRN